MHRIVTRLQKFATHERFVRDIIIARHRRHLPMNSPNRRQFLGTAAVSLVVLNSPVLADDDKKKKKKEPKPFDAGSLADDFKDDGIYDKHVREEKVFVRRFENRLTAFSAICTHKKTSAAPATAAFSTSTATRPKATPRSPSSVTASPSSKAG
jgi:hypothetical protein